MPTPIATSTIAAQAFRAMEAGPISSFGDDTPQARAAAEQYPVAMMICLEAADWSFASVYAALPEINLTAPAVVDPDLPYSYALPGDCLLIREVIDPAIRYRRDRDALRANAAGPLRLRYTTMIDDESKLPATFRSAVAFRLASLIAPQWLTVDTKLARLEARAETALKQAMAADRQQASWSRYDARPDQSDWAAEATA